MIIDPKGLFLGDRLSLCSDEAQLHWTRLYAAANNYARMELNYQKIMASAYASFKKPLAEAKFWELIKEYHDNFLLFIYEHDGNLWGQWQTNERYLLGHKNAEDKRSPNPPVEEQEKYRQSYLDFKANKNQSIQALADLRRVVVSCGDHTGVTVAGVGVGVGEGLNTNTKTKPSRDKREEKSSDPRHSPFKDATQEYWRSKNPEIEMPWDGSEAKALSRLLKANPKLDLAAFKTCLRNRYKSALNHAARPREWLDRATNYALSPLNEYRNPLQTGSKPFEPGVTTQESFTPEAIEYFKQKGIGT